MGGAFAPPFLTTDLTIKQPEPEVPEEPEIPEVSDDGIKTKFTAVDEWVTPKIEVNLRNKPSADNSVAEVIVTLKAGEVFHRIGINTDVGWSKVEYNGQILYCVSSMVEITDKPTE